MRNLQINTQSESSCLLVRQELLVSIRQDLDGLAELFAPFDLDNDYLDNEVVNGIVRARAAIERGTQLIDGLLNAHQ
jgi:hypothetical protein